MTKSKKALITGATGMVGSHLIDLLLEESDWDIVGLIRWRSPLDNLADALSSADKNRITFEYADIRDAHALDTVFKKTSPDYVFHLAAQSFPRVSFDGPAETLDTNVTGTANVLEAVRRNCPEAIVHVCSSSEVFGRVPPHLVPIAEDTPFHPASPYAISKAGTDLLGRFYAEAYGMNTQITRMFTHTGPRRGDVFAESTFAKQIARIESGKQNPVVLVGNLDSLRTIADVRDAVRAYYQLVTINPVPGEVYNIGGNDTMTIKEILDFLINESPKRGEIEVKIDPDRLRPIDADLQIPTTEKFRKHTGWAPTISSEKTLTDLLDYWRNEIRRGRTVVNR
jgi:GDP-mannose 4,6-dehydratase